MAGRSFSQDDYRAAVDELDRLCVREYGVGLVELLKDEEGESLTLERLRRLTGILVKQPFAAPEKASPEDTETGSNYRWEWNFGRLQEAADRATPEYQLLSEIVIEPGEDPDAITADQRMGRMGALAERGVYKCLSLWIKDKLKGDETRSFREYSAQPESAEFASLLNIADFATHGAIGGVLATFVGIPTVAVSLAVIMGKYGYTKLTEGAREHPDI